MAKRAFLIPLFCSIAAFAATNDSRFSPPDGWTESKIGSDMLVYQGNSDRHEAVSIVEDASVKGQAPDRDDAKLIQTMKEAGQFPRYLAGITDWKVDRVERKTLSSGGAKIVVTGSYLNIKKERVYFQEWKYFLQTGYGQIDYTETRDSAPASKDEARIEGILKRYRPFGT